MAHILIIDDDKDFRQMLQEMLEREGYAVSSAVDGAEGIKLFKNKAADLVITDIIMPEKEGLETILTLRQDYPDVKIFAISGGGRTHPGNYLITAKHFGAMKTFMKPFNKNELLGAIREVI
ncbi:MAG: response regulator [Bacteroidales bacterium]|nr:response regulator [Bacteroidales bacterium]